MYFLFQIHCNYRMKTSAMLMSKHFWFWIQMLYPAILMMSTYFSFLKIPSLTLSTTIIFFIWSLIIWAMLRMINFNYVMISSHVLSTYILALKMKACESMVSHVFIALLVEFFFSYYMYEDQNEFKRDHFWSKRKAMGIINLNYF